MKWQLTLLILLAFVMSFPVSAQEMPDQIRQKIEKHGIGEWIDTRSLDGEETIALTRRTWSKDKQVFLMECVTAQGRDYEVGYWNGNEFVSQGHSTSGDNWVIKYDTFGEDAWTGHGSGMQGGTWKEWDSTIKFVDDGFRYEEATDEYELVIVGQRQFAKSSKDAAKAFGDFMVGGVWTTVDGDGNTKKHAYGWMYGRQFFNMTPIIDPEPGSSFHGFDPISGFYRIWGFNMNGFMGATGMQVSKNEWIFVAQFQTEIGLVQGRATFEATDENTLTINAQATIDGEPQEPTVTVWHRVQQ